MADTLKVAAALAEMIYARNDKDQPITLEDIDIQQGTQLTVRNVDAQLPPGSNLTRFAITPQISGNNFYYSDTGFVGGVFNHRQRSLESVDFQSCGSKLTYSRAKLDRDA